MPDLRRLSLKVDLLMESQVIIQLVRWDLLALIPRKAVLRQSVQQERFLSLEVCICTIITIKLLCHVKAYFSIQLPCYWTKCFQDCVSWPSLLFACPMCMCSRFMSIEKCSPCYEIVRLFVCEQFLRQMVIWAKKWYRRETLCNQIMQTDSLWFLHVNMILVWSLFLCRG